MMTLPPDTILDRILDCEFGRASGDARRVLCSYNGNEQTRVWLAMIKLARGSMDELQSLASVAMVDYRDVIAMAEYPSAYRLMPETSDEKLAAAKRADKTQYEAWLDKGCNTP
ncbi:MAG: hypothetical protein ACIAQU_08095 [Phycisphaerales bacterium JB064]